MLRVENLRELQRKIRVVDKGLGPKLRLTNKAAAEVAQTGVDPLVPVGSGKLANSVGVVASQTSAAVKAGTAARVPYAGVINFGWPARGIEGKHFLEKGVAAKEQQIREKYDVEIRQFLNLIDTKRIGR
jgi:hypothetical protein